VDEPDQIDEQHRCVALFWKTSVGAQGSKGFLAVSLARLSGVAGIGRPPIATRPKGPDPEHCTDPSRIGLDPPGWCDVCVSSGGVQASAWHPESLVRRRSCEGWIVAPRESARYLRTKKRLAFICDSKFRECRGHRLRLRIGLFQELGGVDGAGRNRLPEIAGQHNSAATAHQFRRIVGGPCLPDVGAPVFNFTGASIGNLSYNWGLEQNKRSEGITGHDERFFFTPGFDVRTCGYATRIARSPWNRDDNQLDKPETEPRRD